MRWCGWMLWLSSSYRLPQTAASVAAAAGVVLDWNWYTQKTWSVTMKKGRRISSHTAIWYNKNITHEWLYMWRAIDYHYSSNIIGLSEDNTGPFPMLIHTFFSHCCPSWIIMLYSECKVDGLTLLLDLAHFRDQHLFPWWYSWKTQHLSGENLQNFFFL